MSWLIEIRKEAGSEELHLTWQNQDGSTTLETVKARSAYAADEAYYVLSRLAPKARGPNLVRQMIRTARSSPRGS